MILLLRIIVPIRPTETLWDASGSGSTGNFTLTGKDNIRTYLKWTRVS